MILAWAALYSDLDECGHVGAVFQLLDGCGPGVPEALSGSYVSVVLPLASGPTIMGN